MNDIRSTIQCRLRPIMYCQTSTDSPNAAPNEATVPTITSAAMRLLVMINMMRKMRQSDAVTAINKS